MVVIPNHIIVLMVYVNLQNANVIMRVLEERGIVMDVADVVEKIRDWLFVRRFKKYMREYEREKNVNNS
jgi:hypothetical protein